ncbi:MAG TPA: hypothetical protein VK154_06405 [Chitinophagales bacterium]|nr:hypothetical protein [Chitinophagales bacterium]
MKLYHITIFLLTCFTLSAYGQHEFEFVSGRSNYLYRGISNPVKIMHEGKFINPGKFDITIEGGSFKSTDTCLWITIDQWNATLTIADKQHKKTFSHTFTELTLPMPRIALDGRNSGGKTNKYDLLALSGFIGRPMGGLAKMERVLSYDARFYIGNEARFFQCKGPFLSDTLKTFIKKLRPFDRVEFSTFNLGQFRTEYLPCVFEITGASSFMYDFQDILYDYKNRSYDWESFTQKPFEKPYELNEFSYNYYDTFPRIIETNCNSNTDTCSMSVYYLLNNTKTLTYRYYFRGDDSLRVNYFYHDTLLASIGYWRDHLCGKCSIFYPNGNKRAEGQFKASEKYFRQDTMMGISPITLQESYVIGPRYNGPVREGMWNYYDNGIPLKTVWYKEDEVIEIKKYYTGEE